MFSVTVGVDARLGVTEGRLETETQRALPQKLISE